MKRPLPTLLMIMLSLMPLTAAKLQLGGSLQNDTAALLDNGAGEYANIIEGRFIFQYQGNNWRIYSDMRLYHNSGSAIRDLEEVSFSLVRSFIRITPSWMELTLGKTYLNFGAPVLFNPFEMDKALSLNDLSKTKTGRAAFTLDLPLGDFSGFKIYTAPGDPAWAAGAGLYTRLAGFDISLIYNRLSRDRNLAGASLQGDIILGASISWAVHFDDKGNNTFFEVAASLDYSFGSFYLAIGCYYNGRGKTHASSSETAVPEDSYTLGRMTLFIRNRLKFDEFFSITFDCFTNPYDRSFILMPGLYWTAMQGLFVNTIISLPFGKEGGEYSPSRTGDLAVLMRVTAKF